MIQVDSSSRLVIYWCNSFSPLSSMQFIFLGFPSCWGGGGGEERKEGELGQSFPAAALALRKGGREAGWWYPANSSYLCLPHSLARFLLGLCKLEEDLVFFGLCPKSFKSHLGKGDVGKTSRLTPSWRRLCGTHAAGTIIHDVKWPIKFWQE